MFGWEVAKEGLPKKKGEYKFLFEDGTKIREGRYYFNGKGLSMGVGGRTLIPNKYIKAWDYLSSNTTSMGRGPRPGAGQRPAQLGRPVPGGRRVTNNRGIKKTPQNGISKEVLERLKEELLGSEEPKVEDSKDLIGILGKELGISQETVDILRKEIGVSKESKKEEDSEWEITIKVKKVK